MWWITHVLSKQVSLYKVQLITLRLVALTNSHRLWYYQLQVHLSFNFNYCKLIYMPFKLILYLQLLLTALTSHHCLMHLESQGLPSLLLYHQVQLSKPLTTLLIPPTHNSHSTLLISMLDYFL